MTLAECETALEDFRTRLEDAFAQTQASTHPAPTWSEQPDEPAAPSVETGVTRARLDSIVTALVTFPEGFRPHRKLERILGARRTDFDADRIDWALGESLAFGSLLQEGTPVRIAGQDTRRGTFSQRHAAVVDYTTEAEYLPLEHLPDAKAPFMIYDSVLSEFAALGFEYGYSVADRDALVCWEAQFGDFVNGGQVIIDQFLVAALDKWGQRSALTLLLPHGFEGQGPEHSSARLERFLVLCAEDNMRVVYPSTAAQYFHVLRRQVHDPDRKPLIVMTPKRYLRMPATVSSVTDLTDGAFQLLLPDPAAPAPESVERLIFTSGKFAYELMSRRDEVGARVAIVRVEQLYPWPEHEIAAVLAQYPNAEVLWAQEEPGNMGARYFIRRRIEELAGGREVRVVARHESPSPASGSSTVHDAEQQALLVEAVPN
jgi:2-oxoglutarate dehydrogenase E1 component